MHSLKLQTSCTKIDTEEYRLKHSSRGNQAFPQAGQLSGESRLDLPLQIQVVYSENEQQQLNELSLKTLAGNEQQPPHQYAALLRRLLNYHDWRYYVISEPVITDHDYDRLFSTLKQLEQNHPELITPDSPTQRIARGLTDEFLQVEHLVSMLSLDNSYDEADLLEFDNRVKRLIGNEQTAYCVEPKFDGASIALVYEDDMLVRAATRGDGAVGEDITNNAKALASIPLSAAFSKYGLRKVELRGEVIIQKEVFEKVNRAQIEKGRKSFQNARNTASGSLRLKNPSEVAERGLEAFLYQISYAEDTAGKSAFGSTLHTHSEAIEILHQCGFKTPFREMKVCNTIGEVLAFTKVWDEKRLHFNYETDGMVIKLNDFRLQQKCGYTAHHPRWAIAFKFAAKQAQARLSAVSFSVGRTGAITPIAHIEPVRLAGVTITNISLHNEDFIREKDIRLNDMVIVERAGEVIPYIVGSVPALRNGSETEIIFPKNCPSCGEELVKAEDEAAWRCDNADCPTQIEERAIHFVSKDAMDIDGLGRSIVVDFIQRGYIKSLEDIYRLPYEQILELEGWGTRSVEKLKAGIEDSKQRPIWRLLNALGIRHVGVTTAKDISTHLGNLLELKDYTLDKLMDIEGIGPKVAQSIYDFFQTESNVHLIVELARLGVNIENSKTAAKAGGKLEGKTFLFTGSLQHFTRDRAKELVEENGGRILSGVSANLNYLVVGEDAGSKLAKAKKIPSIAVLTEEEFLKMIE